MMMMNLPVKRVGSGKDSLGKASGLCRARRPVTAGRTRQIPCVHPPFEALGVVLVAALEPRDLLLERLEIVDDLLHCSRIVFLDGHIEEFPGIAETGLQIIEADDNVFELRTLPAERLGALGFVPHIRLFELALDLGQAFRLVVVVKDTSSTHRSVL